MLNAGFYDTMVRVKEVKDNYISSLMLYCTSFIGFQLISSLQSREVTPNSSNLLSRILPITIFSLYSYHNLMRNKSINK